jgi:hypothetical protein
MSKMNWGRVRKEAQMARDGFEQVLEVAQDNKRDWSDYMTGRAGGLNRGGREGPQVVRGAKGRR